MTDEERVAYLVAGASGSLDPAERAELDSLRSLLADQAIWIEPDPDLEQRIVDSITAAATTAQPALASPPYAPASGVTQLARHKSRRLRYVILGVAAAALLAVGLAVGLTAHHSNPVQFAASLKPTALAPGATGKATLTKTANGWRIHLDTTGLPRRDGGAYYEAWLKNASGVLVPIGTFNQAADVTLWAGVPPTTFPTLTITRQVVGHGQASSGQVVLAGASERIH
jgi:hypothetical protein